METQLFVCNKNEYHFLYDPTQIIAKEKSSKIIYIGHFEGEAPPPLKTGTTYCLKKIETYNPADLHYASSRECYDLVDFRGNHLRKILAMDDAAKATVSELRGSNTCKTRVCMMIEPCYKSLEPYFRHCSDYTARDRLDIVRQFAEGSRELGGDANKLANFTVMAHRDIKWENGMQDPSESGIHIRLVDFATIWLGTNDVQGTMRRSGTKLFVLSPENTSPESVMHIEKVSEKTDVYALGMMLASLFVRHNGAYVNPSKIWCNKNGWGDDKETQTLSKQMERCLKTYDSKAAFESWIERDLRETHGISLTWETHQDPEITDMIRKLFYQATRITPSKRITRNAFIEQLCRIMRQLDMQAAMTERMPVSVYLFDGGGAEEYREQYRKAAAGVLRMEQEAAKQRFALPPQALCVSYYSPLSGNKRSDCLNQLASYPVSCEQELADSLGNLRTAQPSDTNLLLYAIYKAYDYLCNRKERYRFTGNVYLFCPQLPSDSQLTPFSTRERDYDLESMLTVTLNALQQGQTYLYAHTGRKPGPQEGNWCDYELFSEEPQPAPEPVARPDTVRSDGYLFDVSDTALYVSLPNGERLYVGMIKE